MITNNFRVSCLNLYVFDQRHLINNIFILFFQAEHEIVLHTATIGCANSTAANFVCNNFQVFRYLVDEYTRSLYKLRESRDLKPFVAANEAADWQCQPETQNDISIWRCNDLR